jgi:outer membrane protein assembly factor BamA
MSQLKNIATDIESFYQRKKYYNVIIDFPKAIPITKDKIEIDIHINEFPKLKIDSIKISGQRYFSRQKLNDKLNIERYKDLVSINSLLQDIVKLYSERGYFFCETKLDSIQMNDHKLIPYISLKEGGLCRFNKFLFQGNKVTKSNTLLKLSGISKLKNITPEILQKASENISQRPYISECQIFPVNQSTLVFSVKETKTTKLNGLAGYNSKKITGYINIIFLNLYGTDRELSLYWNNMNSLKNIVEFSYHDSGIPKYPIAGDFKLLRCENDSTSIHTNFSTFIYYYTFNSKYGIKFQVDDYFPGSRRPKTIQKSSYKKIGISQNYNNLDYLENPTRGFRIKSEYTLVLNQKNSKYNNKYSYKITYSFYNKLYSKYILAVSLNWKEIQNKNLQSYEYFFLGGNRNLRGFPEDFFSGYKIGWVNLELRYILSQKSRLFIFQDYGYVKNINFTIGKIVGTGFGLRLNTKVGIVKIDYGIHYYQNKWSNPMDGYIHFGIETYF